MSDSRVAQVAFQIILTLLLVACAGGPATTESPETEEPEAGEAETTAVALWAELQSANYAEDWATVPGKGTLYPGQAPHGALISIYLNPESAKTLETQPGQMPEEAIVLKENYTADETLDSVTVMRKQAGFDPDHNDWFWAKYGADGTVQAAGQPDGCISCHGAVRTNDYVFTFPIAPMEADVMEPSDEAMSQAQTLWEELQAASYPDDWATVPGKGPLTPGQSPHGALISVYLNSEAMQALETQRGQIPEEAIVLKENYTADETLDSVTVMRKQAGFDPEHNDWFWAKYGAEGTVQAAGKPAGCISCHGAVRSNDYVFSFLVAPISPSGPPDAE